MNDTANLTLALSSSPIMSSNATEAREIGAIISALVLNMGTVDAGDVNCARIAGRYARSSISGNGSDKKEKRKVPIILDPVGVGASALRKKTIRDLMDDVHVSIIKGNAGEIGALAGLSEVASRGVDSDPTGPGFSDPARVVRELARREKCVVVMSGRDDYISDGSGRGTWKCGNGSEWQGRITGSGCMATTAIACLAGVAGEGRALESAMAG